MARETQKTPVSVLLSIAVHVLVLGIFVIRATNISELEAPKGGPAPVQAFAITSEEQIKHWEKILKDPKLLQREKLQAELRRLDQKHKDDQKRAREEKQKKQKELTKLKAKNKRIKERRKVAAEEKRINDIKIKKQKARQKKAKAADRKQKALEKAEADKIRRELRKKKQVARAKKQRKLKKIKSQERAAQKRVDNARRKAMEAERLGLEKANANDFSSEKAKYGVAILNAVRANWNKPPNLPDTLVCEIRFKQTRTGYVLDRHVTPSAGCSGVFLRSIEEAARLTKKLPQPDVPEIFDKNIDISFYSKDGSN